MTLLLLTPVFAILNIILFTRLYRFIFAKHFPRRWASNISGNPYAADRILTAFLGPFPELNDFNIVLGRFPVDKAIILHGYPPLVRYWGFQIFLPDLVRNKDEQTLADFQIILDGDTKPLDFTGEKKFKVQRHDQKFTIVISTAENRPSWAKNFVDVERFSPDREGHITFRAYCPYHGGAFKTPKVYRIEPEKLKNTTSFDDFLSSTRTEAVTLLNEERVFGPWSTVSNVNSERNRLFEVIVINLASMVFFSLLGVFTSAFDLVVFYGVTTALSGFIYSKLFQFAEKRYRRMFEPEFGPPNTRANLPDPHSSTANNPNHKYFSVSYDAREKDVLIHGWRTGPFRYTSLHCYHWNSLPIPQFLFDDSLVSEPESLAQGEDKYIVRLTTNPSYDGSSNVINVSEAPVGICMIRLVYPDNEEVIHKYAPTLEVVEKGQRSKLKKN